MDAERLGVFICYESAFPDEVRQFVKGGANLLVNISNDGYFGHSAAREQHLEIARMRAVENSRWLIRSTNDGITAVIDPDRAASTSGCRCTRRLVAHDAFRLSQRHHVLHRTTAIGSPGAV